MTVDDVMPEFALELRRLIEASLRPELAAQVGTLQVVDRCRCRQRNCAHFYTAPCPDGAYGPGHRNVRLAATCGFIVLDVVDDRIVAVEVLDRADVRRKLDAHLPL